ncbi:lytic transglycosylase domain-containing protein [Janthinobacterium sp. B9-8]|uniref:lytic transglycosylase domain-containing protein n=1 Tax=Janthinobacterium sp. B9-8 TaxID=1236179 RepID=UPI0006994C36|nr:transglycosylase SLT domain-containing protein [Janthinobacterium sp. B9-8]AMC34230.1 hypothetical protein VN23_06285 [Janthinobacterium sp. B9-8]
MNKKAIVVIALGLGGLWLLMAKAQKAGETQKEGGFFLPDVFGFMKASLSDAGEYLEDAFDLINSDFKKSVTSGRGNQYVTELEQIGRNRGLPNYLLSRIAYQESRFKETAYNTGSKAAGMFQINPITVVELSRQLGTKVDPYNWKQAGDAAAVYLAYLYRKYGDWTKAVAAYNCGPGTLNKHLAANGGRFVPEKMPQKEQRVYALEVMADISLD